MSFLIKNQKLLEACNKKWGKISTIMQKGFYSKPVENEIYLKTIIKPDSGKTNTSSRREGSHFVYLPVI